MLVNGRMVKKHFTPDYSLMINSKIIVVLCTQTIPYILESLIIMKDPVLEIIHILIAWYIMVNG
jgi:hypothetical protein